MAGSLHYSGALLLLVTCCGCGLGAALQTLVSHTWLHVTDGPFLLEGVQMFLLSLILQAHVGVVDTSWSDLSASGFQALALLPWGDSGLVFQKQQNLQ